MERAYRNLGYVLLALLPIFLAGFWIPYLSEFPNFDASITTAVHIHAALLFCFLGLLIVQPLAIRYRAFSTHRILGKLSNVLMPFILVFSVAMLWKEYHEHLDSGATLAAARNAELLSATQLLLLACFYGLSISCIRKRDVSAHMRYMICIALILLPAGLARTLGILVSPSAIRVSGRVPRVSRRLPHRIDHLRQASAISSTPIHDRALGLSRH
jgi:hypothetical protein